MVSCKCCNYEVNSVYSVYNCNCIVDSIVLLFGTPRLSRIKCKGNNIEAKNCGLVMKFKI